MSYSALRIQRGDRFCTCVFTFTGVHTNDAAAEPGPLPQGGMTQVSFRNTHLIYALTWFCLALMSAGAAIFLIRRGGEEAP